MLSPWLFFRDLSRLQISCITHGGAPDLVLHRADSSEEKLPTGAQPCTDAPAIWPLSRRLKNELLNSGVSRQLCAEAIKTSTQHS